MKKYVFIILLIILIVFISIFIIMRKNKKEVDIVVYTNGGVPYEWKYELSNNNVKLVKEYSKAMNKDKKIAGGRIEKHYVFKGIKKGKTKITFKYINFVNNIEDSKETYIITVDDKLNCILKKE